MGGVKDVNVSNAPSQPRPRLRSFVLPSITRDWMFLHGFLLPPFRHAWLTQPPANLLTLR